MEEEILFHYTSLETLFAIIQGINIDNSNNSSFTLRATHTCFLNDLSEGKLLPKALKIIGVNSIDIWMSECRLGFPFVLSLSELKDDLNMWRCYGNQGRGVSIGLNKTVLSNLSTNNLKLSRCNYVTQEEMIEKLKNKNVEQIIKSSNVLELDRLMSDLLIYKDKSFHAEEEWRLHVFHIETNYQIRDNLIIPYKEISIPISALQTITLGPKCDFERNKFAINRILMSKLSSDRNIVKIEKSKIPLK